MRAVPARRDRPATPEAVARATDPEILRMAWRAARGAGRRFRPLADEYESVVWVALWDAALDYHDGSPMAWPAYAGWRIRNALLDLARHWNGRRGGRSGRRDRPESVSIDRDDFCDGRGEPAPLADLLAADELPVGWELDSLDACENAVDYLPDGLGRSTLIDLFTRAGTPTQAEIAARDGVSGSAVSRRLRAALAELRRRITPEDLDR